MYTYVLPTEILSGFEVYNFWIIEIWFEVFDGFWFPFCPI